MWPITTFFFFFFLELFIEQYDVEFSHSPATAGFVATCVLLLSIARPMSRFLSWCTTVKQFVTHTRKKKKGGPKRLWVFNLIACYIFVARWFNIYFFTRCHSALTFIRLSPFFPIKHQRALLCFFLFNCIRIYHTKREKLFILRLLFYRRGCLGQRRQKRKNVCLKF